MAMARRWNRFLQRPNLSPWSSLLVNVDHGLVAVAKLRPCVAAWLLLLLLLLLLPLALGTP
jgi:hypothetical protein